MSNQFDVFDGRMEAAERTAARAVAGKWNGRGKAPSREAAIEWAVSRGVPEDEVEALIKGRSLDQIGTSARRAVEQRGGEARQRASREGSRAGTAPEAPATVATGKSAVELDKNDDGQITPDEISPEDQAIFGDGPEAPTIDPRGAPLWPFGSEDPNSTSPGAYSGLTVRDRSTTGQHMEDSRFGNARVERRTGPRYYERDAVEPLKWSAERRADLQRVMRGLGLYGDAEIRLGVWTQRDQEVYASAVLSNANVEGVTWHELLARWHVTGLPPDIAQQLEDQRTQAPKKPTLQLTDPATIQSAGRATTRSMIGRDDPTFAQGLVPSYQAAETAAQQAVIADQDAGGGGTVTEAPNLQTFAEQRLEETNPVEVDSYAVLTNFNEMLRMLGAAG